MVSERDWRKNCLVGSLLRHTNLRVMKIQSPLLLLPFLFSSANGTVVLTDNFSYTNGLLVGATDSPWVSHSGTTAQADVSSGALNLSASETEDVSAALSGQPYTSGVLTATFDVKFTALPTASGSYFAHFKPTAANNFRADLTAFTTGASSGFFRLGISNDSFATVPVAVDLSLNTIYSVVMTWDLNTNRSSLSVNGGTAVTDTDPASSIAVYAFAFRQNSGIGTLTVDNLVVTAVPETTAALLGSLGVLGLLRRRRVA